MGAGLLVAYFVWVPQTGPGSLYQFFIDPATTSYSLIDADVARLAADDFLERQQAARVYYRPLRDRIETKLNDWPGVAISYYFEDFDTWSWIGVHEREGYIPASLAKIPTLAAVLKKLEIEDDEDLNTPLVVASTDFDPRSGISQQGDIGTTKSIAELAQLFLGASDNTAGWTLKRILDEHDLIEARVAMGMPPLDEPGALVSPKTYSNVFRSLYRSTYLPREMSNFILGILANSLYPEGIVAGVPESVRVANKVGAFAEYDAYHDCGVVYHPEHTYFICVMTQGATSFSDANTIFQELSHITYDYVTYGDEHEPDHAHE
jgi:beta-lactamase class A